jgi:hypothetical protein
MDEEEGIIIRALLSLLSLVQPRIDNETRKMASKRNNVVIPYSLVIHARRHRTEQ